MRNTSNGPVWTPTCAHLREAKSAIHDVLGHHGHASGEVMAAQLYHKQLERTYRRCGC